MGPEAGFNLNGTPSNYKINSAYTRDRKIDIKINVSGSRPTFANFHIHRSDNFWHALTRERVRGQTRKIPEWRMMSSMVSHNRTIRTRDVMERLVDVRSKRTQKQSTQLVKGIGFLKAGCPQ